VPTTTTTIRAQRISRLRRRHCRGRAEVSTSCSFRFNRFRPIRVVRRSSSDENGAPIAHAMVMLMNRPAERG